MSKSIVDLAIDAAVGNEGSRQAVARKLGISRQAMDQWKGTIPPRHVLAMEQMSGYSRHVLRPDIYGPAPKQERPTRRAPARIERRVA